MALQDLTPQLRTRLRRVEKIVGLFVGVAALLLLAGFVYYLYHTAERKGWFLPKCPYYTYVQTAEGLKEGDPVSLMGFPVGKITMITAQPPYDPNPVFVAFEVKQPYYGYVWSNSTVKVLSASFLGQRQLELTKGSGDSKPTVEGDKVRIGKRLVPFAKAGTGPFVPPDEQPALSERAEKLVSQVEQALPAILGQVNTILTNTAQLTANLDRLVSNAQPAVTNLSVITANLRDPHGSLGEWLIPTNVNSQLNVTLGNVNTNLNSLNQTLLNLASITSNLNTQVQANDRMLGEISHLVTETDDLVQGLKRHWLLKGAFPEPSTNAATPLLQPEMK